MLIHGAGPRPPRIAAAPAGPTAGRRPASGRTNPERRKLFLEGRRLTLRTGGLRRSLKQELKAMIAFPADIFEDRHVGHSLCFHYMSDDQRSATDEAGNVSGGKDICAAVQSGRELP